MFTETGKTAVIDKNGSGSTPANRRIKWQDTPTIIRHIRENETVYAVVTPVKLNG